MNMQRTNERTMSNGSSKPQLRRRLFFSPTRLSPDNAGFAGRESYSFFSTNVNAGEEQHDVILIHAGTAC